MFAAAEKKILARLRERLPPTVYVGAIQDQDGAKELRQRAPAVWVIYDGYTAGASIPNQPTIHQIVQEWAIVIQTRSARGNGSTDAARDEASDLCDTVIGALLGYSLGAGKPLHLREAAGPEYDAGYCFVPLAFSSAATFRATP